MENKKTELSQSKTDVEDFMKDVNVSASGASQATTSGFQRTEVAKEVVFDGLLRLSDFVAKQKKQKSKQALLSMAIAKYRLERDRFAKLEDES